MNRLQKHSVISGLLIGACAVLPACGGGGGTAPPGSSGGENGLGTGGFGTGGEGVGGEGAGGFSTSNGGSQQSAGGTENGGTGAGGSAQAGGATGGGSGGATGGACDPTGTWAIQFTTNVQWAATAVISAGSGSQVLRLLSQRTYDAGTMTVTDTAQICSLTVPSFSSPLAGTITVTFPTAAFNAPGHPVMTTLVTTVSGTTPGSTFQSAPSAVLVGGQLANPVTDPFPCFGTTAGCGSSYPNAPLGVISTFSVDADNDGKPGITADDNSVPTLYDAPADRLYLAFRSVASAAGTTDTCDHGSGTLDLTSVNQGILGCHTTSGADCDTNGTQYVNDNGPVWTPASGSKIAMTRLSSGASCSDVANATF